MFKTFINIFRVPELRNKVLFTLMMLAIYRIGYHVPIPGVNQRKNAAAHRDTRFTSVPGLFPRLPVGFDLPALLNV